MMVKTSSEIQEIFGLGRDDIRRLEKDEVLKPQKSCQGKASMFDDNDLNRLLDIKIYLLSGYRISDMKTIFTDEYDSAESIDEQIHTYKKRIQMLEFIQTMRKDIEKLGKLNKKQIIEAGVVTSENTKMPKYGTKEYYDLSLDFIKLIFTIDFLSQKESFRSENEIILKRSLAAYRVIERVIDMSGEDIPHEDIKTIFLEMAETPIEDETEIKELTKEIVEEYMSHKEQIMADIVEVCITPIKNKLDEETGIAYREMLQHIYQFVLDYFVDQKELYYVYVNFRKFVNALDKSALENGIIMLGGKN